MRMIVNKYECTNGSRTVNVNCELRALGSRLVLTVLFTVDIRYRLYGIITAECTGWLKIKYPTRQYAISSQLVVRF